MNTEATPQMEIDGQPACYVLWQNPTNGHFYPTLVMFEVEGHSPTNWDYGTDERIARKALDEINAMRGYTPFATRLVQATTFGKNTNVTREMIRNAE